MHIQFKASLFNVCSSTEDKTYLVRVIGEGSVGEIVVCDDWCSYKTIAFVQLNVFTLMDSSK